MIAYYIYAFLSNLTFTKTNTIYELAYINTITYILKQNTINIAEKDNKLLFILQGTLKLCNLSTRPENVDKCDPFKFYGE